MKVPKHPRQALSKTGSQREVKGTGSVPRSNGGPKPSSDSAAKLVGKPDVVFNWQELTSQRSLGDALFNSALAVAVTDAAGRFLLANENFCKIFSYTTEELLSRNWASLVHPDDWTERSPGWRMSLRQSSASVPISEKRCVRKGGTEVWVRGTLSRLSERGKPSLYLGIFEDVTEEMRAQHALAEKQAEVKEAQELAQFRHWQWDPKKDVVVWTDELYRAIDYDPKLPVPSFTKQSRFFTPASWQKLKRTMKDTLNTGRPFELELEIIRSDGTRVWMISRGEPVRNSRGRIVSLRGAVLDITTRKQAELALRQSEEKFTKAFGAVPIAVTIATAAEGRQIEVNDALLQMTGYERDDVIGHTFLELGYWDDPGDRQKLYERLLAGEHLRNVECRFRRKNRELFTALLSADLVELNGQQCIVAAVMDISDLRRAEQSIRTLESKLALHFEQTPVAVIELDTEFKINEWNPAAEAIFGYKRHEVIGRDPRDLIVPEHMRMESSAVLDEIADATGRRRSINRNVTKAGKEIICEWFNTPLVGEDGHVLGVISLAHDITRQQEAQAELMRSQTILSAVFESTEDMIWIVDPERFGMTMFNSGVSRYFAEHRGMQLRVGMTPDDLLPTPVLRELWKRFYRRAAKGESFSLEYEVFAGTDILQLSFYPLKRDDTVFGISVFGANVTHARRAERALRDSEERYRKLVEASNDWVWEVDAGGTYTYAGPQCRQILGYEPEELVGRKPFELMPKAEARRISELFKRLAAARKPYRSLENTNLHKNGSRVVLETNVAPVFNDQGELVGYLGMDRDITERKRSEMALRESEERFRLAAQASRMYASEWDAATETVQRSGECVDILGLAPDAVNITGREFIARLHPDDREQFLNAISALIPDEPFARVIYRFLRPDGMTVWLEERIRGFFDSQGSLLRTIGMSVDITARKEAEEARRDSERRLRLALESGQMYAFEWDVRTDLMRRSEESVAVLGDTDYPTVDTGSEFLKRLHPEDRTRYTEVLAQLTPGEDSYHMQYRKLLSSGRTRWIEARGRGFFDAEGKLARVIGIASDITARKESEDALRETSARLINAQEEERKRFARELHDGVSQALAIVSIEVAQAAKMSTDPDLRSKLEKMYGQVQVLVSDVGHLSHELHPSTLKHLGLTAAIRFLCREISEAHGIDVEFAEKGQSEPSSKEVSLCLYRIAQEALQNVVKHSQSRRAWVELTGSADEIRICIRDEGAGFNMRAKKSGLGLVSMRERLRLVGGSITINSRPTFGTRIEAHVPLAPAIRVAA